VQYLPLVGLMVLGILFAAVSFVASRLLAPRRPNDKKNSAYECGIEPAKETPERFPVRFFLIAMIFIVFDIELIFFYPWAVAHESLGAFGLVAILIFAFAVFESFIYLIGNGALEWGPVHQARRLQTGVSAERTTRSTVRRVGGEGRLDAMLSDKAVLPNAMLPNVATSTDDEAA
jgi:NADH-quinone oxidoreductase subunit A